MRPASTCRELAIDPYVRSTAACGSDVRQSGVRILVSVSLQVGDGHWESFE